MLYGRNSRELLPTEDALTDSYLVLLMDQRGHGRSTRRPQDLSHAAFMGVISTDTAFLIGILALLGKAVPSQLPVFLLALAIGVEHSTDMRIVGRSSSQRTRWLRDWADAHGQSSVLIDLDVDDISDAYMGKLGLTEADLPVAVIRSQKSVPRDPDETHLRDALHATDTT